MTPANFLLLWIHLAVFAGAGIAASRVFRLRGTNWWLTYLQLLLGGCLLLPAVVPEREMEQPVASAMPAVADWPMAVTSPGPAHRAAAPRWDVRMALQTAILAGILLRCLWLVMGLARLRYYRLRSMPLREYPPALRDALVETGASAEFRLSPTLSGPVTFGFIRPVVLLPAAFSGAPFAEQRAIAIHEALHVARHDWLVSLLEEAVATLLWFQPAVWLLVSEIRLAREQSVDRAAVALTRDRDGYVAALFSVSRGVSMPDCALARPFLGRRHLFQRIHNLLKEDSMSEGRLIVAHAAAVVAVFVASGVAGRALPLQAPPRPEANPSMTITPDGAVPHRAAMEYPDAARRAGLEGTVMVEVTPQSNGIAASARAVSGPDMLREAAEVSALKYLYKSPEIGPGRMAIDFRLPSPGMALNKRITGVHVAFSATPDQPVDQSRLQSFVGQMLTLEKWNEIRDAAPNLALRIDLQDSQTGTSGQLHFSPLFAQQTGPLQHIAVGSSVPAQTAAEVIRRLQPYLRRQIDSDLMAEVYRDVTALWPDLRVSFGVAHIAVSAPEGQIASQSASATAMQPPGTIRVAGPVQAAKLAGGPPPVYPADARAVRVQGVVRFDATITKDGGVSRLTLRRGHPMLVSAATEAVQRWRYQPTLLNGQPVEVETSIDVNFTLPN